MTPSSEPPEEPFSVVGLWQFEYEILSDGTTTTDDPYALLEWTYSDAFELRDDATGLSLWFGSVNTEPFAWQYEEGALTMQVRHEDGAVQEFTYWVEEREDGLVLFTTPKGSTYVLRRIAA